MRKSLSLLIMGLVISWATAPLLAQPVEGIGGIEAVAKDPNRKVHRRAFDTRDADGWITARSIEGRFTVRLPIPFDDITRHEPAPSTTIVTGIESVRDKPEAFTVFRQLRSEAGLQMGDGYLDHFAESTASFGKVVSKQRQKVGKFAAMDVEVAAEDNVTINFRCLATPSDVFLLTVFCRPESKLTKADKQKYFDSLTIESAERK